MERKAYSSGSIIQFSRMKESSWIYFFIHPSSELAQLYFVTGIQARQSRFPTIIIMDEVLSNEGFYHMGMIYPGQFPIKSLMLNGEKLVVDSK